MKTSTLLINEPPLQVLPSLAKVIGLNEAIVTQQLHYWLTNPKCEGYTDETGEKWIFNTYDEWQENFPFWSTSTIKRTFLELEEKQVVISRQFDAKSRDMRKYYRLNYEQLCTLQGVNLTSSTGSHRDDVKGNTETTAENIIPGIESAMFQGREVTNEDIDPGKVEHDTLVAFEEAFKIENGNIPWFKTKPEWTRLRAKLVERYQSDREYFKKYRKWYEEVGKFGGGMNVQQLRRDPEGFVLALNIFDAANAPEGVEERPEFKPFVPEQGKFVPRPK